MKDYAVEVLSESLAKARDMANKFSGALAAVDKGCANTRALLHPASFSGLKGVDAARAILRMYEDRLCSLQAALAKLEA